MRNETRNTDTELALKSLRLSEQRYRLIIDNVGDMIWTLEIPPSLLAAKSAGANAAEIVDALLAQWRFSFVSRAAERVFGYNIEEAAKLSLCDIATPHTVAVIRQALIRAFSSKDAKPEGDPQERLRELEFLAKDGSSRWCEVLSTYLRDDQGTPTNILGITRDVTERRRAERALRESESKLQCLFENLPDFVVVVDRNAIIQFANRGRLEASREAMRGTSGLGYLVPEHQETCRRALANALATGQCQNVESLDIFGTWWADRVVPLVGEDGARDFAMVICTDITQQRAAAEAVEKEKRLLRQLLELHERERQLMAYDIHDGFAQQLAGALFRLQAFRETLARDPAEAWKGFDVASRLIGQSLDEARRLISGLRPPVLDELGIVKAVEYLIHEYRKDGKPEIKFEHDAMPDRLPPPLEGAIFRIVQESLQNACRHSRSDRIRVTLAARDGRVHIDIRDWGVGFDVGGVAENHFGLQGIRERARLLDGRATIESAPGEGTCVLVELPLIDAAGDGLRVR